MKKIVEEIKEILNKKEIQYKEFTHAAVRTSEEADAIRPEYTLSQGAKALIVKVKYTGDKREFVMLIIPGDKRLDSKKVKKALKCKSFSFANEEEVSDVTRGVLPGGVPPFGNLFDLDVYVDTTLSENDEIIFNAGDRKVSIAMKYSDWERMVSPKLLDMIQE